MKATRTANVFQSFSFSIRRPKDKSRIAGLLLIVCMFVICVPAMGKEDDWLTYLGNKTKSKTPPKH
ncbi:MAG: hypothetical protein ACYS3N_15120, partial [Planctomycetota bacterium]